MRDGVKLRLIELLATLSLATDLGTGQPLGHGLRTSILASRIARALGCADERVRSVQQVALLRFLGCTSDAAETASMAGGDDIAFNAAMAPAFYGRSSETLGAMVGAIGKGEPPLRRARMILGAVADPGATREALAGHCEVASMLARRLDVSAPVPTALSHAYERWDGKGWPGGLRGDEIPIEIRIAVVARDADVLHTLGADDVAKVLRRRGAAYDPAVVDAWSSLGEPHPEADWDTVVEAEPEPATRVLDLDGALTAMADFADLKSPWTRGHSRRVAELATSAASLAGFGRGEVTELGRAGLVHDIGRVGVDNGVWDKPAALSTDEWERARLHPYHTHRVLSRCRALSPLEGLASSHHERLDGSGYHRQDPADRLSTAARILAAADVLAALTSGRPHRPALDLADAVSTIGAEVDVGRLDPEAVGWVVGAAGGVFDRPSAEPPAGLTDREAEVLGLIAAGHTNRTMAEILFISPKTVGRHVENIYAKIGVSTRAGATVFAMQHRMVG